jgi:DNA invertase Pin-like site-specific DNA recombinase
MSARTKNGAAPTTTGRITGYARCSTTSQDLTPQIEQLKAAGARRIFAEKISGAEPTGRSG